MLVLCYVNFLLIFGNDEEELQKLESKLAFKLPNNDLSKAKSICGRKIKKGQDYTGIGQRKQILSMVDELGLTERSETYLLRDPSLDFSTIDTRAAD